MERLYSEKQNCCGCTACASICTTKAIEMVPDECGFLYPFVNQLSCVDCGKCSDVCAFTKPNQANIFLQSYIAKHKSNQVVKSSQSGGMFTALSDVILKKDGVVYGAAFGDNFVVRHTRATDYNQRDAIKKSKYVQSNLSGVFSMVAGDLQSGKCVLFTGTPCQCEGLRSYIAKRKVSDTNLIVCDILCHASASPGVYQKYLQFQTTKHNSKIKEYTFRDTEHHGWGEYAERITFENGKTIYTDEYASLFFGDDIRPSCYRCKYTSLCRTGDITIGDCWGGHEIYPELADKTGASLVLVNTDKGSNLFYQASEWITSHEINVERVLQPRLQKPETMSATYDQFWHDYVTIDFSELMSKYSKNNYSLSSVWRKKLRRMITLPYRAARKIVRVLMK